MSGFAEYTAHDGLGLAELIRRGEVSAAEVIEAAILRTEAVNPRLNAVHRPMYDLARSEAAAGPPRGPFHGVPLLLKDLLHAYSGVPLTSGCAALRDFVPDQDSEFVARLRAAGCVAFGKTNVPELGLLAVTEPSGFGVTRNPWDPSRTPGGSSGGSAAAVAARMAPIASATDGGGSIRIPAAWCGIFGLKPSRGRVPTGPQVGEVWSGAVVDHVLTRSVRDSAAVLDAIHSPALGRTRGFMAPGRSFLEAAADPPRSLRIAFTTRSPIGTAVAPECRRAAEDAALLLEQLGHRVEEAEPGVDGMAVARCYLITSFTHAAAELRRIRSTYGRRAARRDVEELTRAQALLGETVSGGELVEARESWHTFARTMAEFHTRYDMYLTPTTAALPPEIGSAEPPFVEKVAIRLVTLLRAGALFRASGLPERLALENLASVPFTQLANLTGQPAMSVPLHWTAEGLPCGVHFMAAVGEEAALLRLAAQLEELKPWKLRAPADAGAA